MLKKYPTTKITSPFGLYQQTLKNPCACHGVGVHSGDVITLALKPAPENSGIVFKRIDLEDETQNRIPVRLQSVVDTRMCTTLGNQYGVVVKTVEHLLAALYACNIDNVVIEVNGAELPIMDGSSQPFIDIMDEVGYQTQHAPRNYIRVLETVQVENDHGVASLRPSTEPFYKATYDFKGRADFGDQSFCMEGTPEAFREQIAQARTFGFLEDAEKVWAMGLAKGTSLDNTVVIENNQILNEQGLRYQTEFVRHKILDTIGDFYVLGCPLLAEFKGDNCGHTLNNVLLQKLFSDCSNWEWVTPEFSQEELAPFRPNVAMSEFRPAMGR